MGGAKRTHELKCWPTYFDAVMTGKKTFEIRENDRDFEHGDMLLLREYRASLDEVLERAQPEAGEFTGRTCLRRICYITNFKQRPGIVVMGLSGPTDADRDLYERLTFVANNVSTVLDEEVERVCDLAAKRLET